MIRLFIAIPVPEDIKDKIAELVERLKDAGALPEGARLVPEENWHFTLVFLGYQPESSVSLIKPLLIPLAPPKFTVQFKRLTYGPLGGPARMIWLTTTKETSTALGRIKNDLEKELEKNGIKWHRENRLYQAHLTLARFEPQNREDLPLIDEDLDFGYSTDEVDLMKSTLKKTGAEYEVL